MNDAPTPRTDAQGYGDGRHPYVPVEFARQLERELAELRKNGGELIASLQTELDGVERELEQERQDRKQADLDTIRALGERNDARAELAAERALADRLAALLQRDRDGYGGQVVDPECDCCDCEYLRPIDEALAAWKASRDQNNLEGARPTEEERRENARAIQAMTVPERFALMFGNQTKEQP